MTPTNIGQQETLAASTEARRLEAARKGTLGGAGGRI
jgi:hypothetical protein